MASSGKFVEVLCPSGRRQKVKTNPSMTVLQILQVVCEKQGYSDAEYDLKHQRKVLNVTSMIRFLNLPNNAKLEMVTCEKPRLVSNVTVALQLEDGNRYQDEFKPDATLLDVLKSLVSNIEEKLSESEPVCIYMRNEYKGIKVLSTTSLKLIGITGGRAAMRVVFHEKELISEASTSNQVGDSSNLNAGSAVKESQMATAESPLNKNKQANDSAPCELKEPNEKKIRLEPSVNPANVSWKDVDQSNQVKDHPSEGNAFKSLSIFGAPPSRIFPDDEPIGKSDILKSPVLSDPVPAVARNDFANFKFPDSTPEEVADDLAIDPHQLRKEIKLGMACDREARLYSMEGAESVNGKTQDVDDSFFKVTIDDLRKRLSDLKSERKGIEEAALMTSALREQQKIQKMSNFEKIPVRFLLPNKLVLQGIFRPLETIGALKDFLNGYLSTKVKKYEIFVTPPRVVLKDKKQTLYEAKLFPAAVVHVSFGKITNTYIKSECMNDVSTYSEAEAIVDKILKRKSCDTANHLPANDVTKRSQNGTQYSEPSPSSSSSSRAQSTSSDKYKQKGGPKWFKTGR